jgi:hypothetical protein
VSWRQHEVVEQRRWEEEFHGQAPTLDGRMERKGTPMGLIAMDSGGGDFKRVPPGTHTARCYRLIDLGTQAVTFSGDTKLQRKIMIGWELFGEDDDGAPLTTDDGMPLTISKRYTMSLHEKAKLRADLESWRGRPFTADELKGFELPKLLGQWCMVNVIHTDNDPAGGKVYANVKSLMPVPKQMKATLPKGVHELQQFDLDDPDMNLFGTFYQKLQETIQASTEWKASRGQPKPAAKPETATAGGSPSAYFDDMDSDVPFSNPYRGKYGLAV